MNLNTTTKTNISININSQLSSFEKHTSLNPAIFAAIRVAIFCFSVQVAGIPITALSTTIGLHLWSDLEFRYFSAANRKYLITSAHSCSGGKTVRRPVLVVQRIPAPSPISSSTRPKCVLMPKSVLCVTSLPASPIIASLKSLSKVTVDAVIRPVKLQHVLGMFCCFCDGVLHTSSRIADRLRSILFNLPNGDTRVRCA